MLGWGLLVTQLPKGHPCSCTQSLTHVVPVRNPSQTRWAGLGWNYFFVCCCPLGSKPFLYPLESYSTNKRLIPLYSDFISEGMVGTSILSCFGVVSKEKIQNSLFKVFRSFQMQTRGRPGSPHILQLSSIHNRLNTSAGGESSCLLLNQTFKWLDRVHSSAAFLIRQDLKNTVILSKTPLFIFVCDGVIVLFSELNMATNCQLSSLTHYQ